MNLWFALLLFSSCIKEKETTYKAYLINKTSHTIQILFYKKGVVSPEDSIYLNNGDTLKIAEGWRRGVDNGAGFSSNHFGSNEDSAVVIYDDSLKVTHYIITPSNVSSKFIVYQDNRNIYNGETYHYEYHDIRNTTYTYTFTEKTMILRKSSN